MSQTTRTIVIPPPADSAPGSAPDVREHVPAPRSPVRAAGVWIVGIAVTLACLVAAVFFVAACAVLTVALAVAPHLSRLTRRTRR